MFVRVQFPLADVRSFGLGETGRLDRPTWPIPKVDNDFVRSVGIVRQRPGGGALPWTGEHLCCDARGAIKFAHGPGKPVRGAEGGVPLTPAYRRYFVAGPVARVDLGFTVERWRAEKPMSGTQILRAAALSVLTLPMFVPMIAPRARELVTLGPAVAKRILQVTTSLRIPPERVESWWMTAARPLILVEDLYDDDRYSGLDDLALAKQGEWPAGEEPMIVHYPLSLNRRGSQIPVWALLFDPRVSKEELRALRLHLWRIHNEREVLRAVLGLCLDKKLHPAKSESLRAYLDKQSKRLRRISAEGLPQRALLDYAYGLDALVNEDELHSLREVLDEVGSPGLTASVMPAARDQSSGGAGGPVGAINVQYAIFGGGTMVTGENAQNIQNSGPTGAVIGGHANVSGGNFQGSGIQQTDSGPDIDLDVLAAELAKLRAALRGQATEPEHDLAIAEVARAEQEARKGDAPAARSALARAGTWAREVAKLAGVPVALEVFRQLNAG
ncbi:hypothetical protein [Actinoplanes sp. NBRC 103695]|uniref:hypothetical protein n=1 Tax=Actinoplanes sp. NBRC 103695 TaxID=3032202 RepID=UPI0025545CCD|nr:hypothetical protein [Actinoplanes sp. NBRC 103695]